MRKIVILFLSVVLFSFSGCSLVFPGADESSETASQAGNDYSAEFESKWCYQRLSPQLKAGYREIYTSVRDGFEKDETVTISDSRLGTQRDYNGIRVELSKPLQSRGDAQILYTAFIWDNPQFFYIGNTYSYEGYRSGKIDYYNIFNLVYTMKAQERKAASKQLEAAVTQILNLLYQAGPKAQFETELILHDELIRICGYETRASNADNPAAIYPTAFTAYGALVEGRAVCEGYSRAMQLLLHRSGIECTLVSGNDQTGVSHMWNFVTIDGYNYHLDPTWDDNTGRVHHSYFNLTTQEILESHTIDADNIGVDTCTATDANYYVRTGKMLDTVKRDKIAEVIALAVRNGETSIDLRFAKNAFANARLFINNRNLLTQKVNGFLKGSGFTMWDYDEYNVNDTYYTLALYKK